MEGLVSSKSYAIAVSLSGVFGVVGIHQFYLGRYAEGVIDLSLFCFTLYFYFTDQLLLALLFFVADAIHTLIVTIMLMTGSIKDGSGKYVYYPGQELN